MLTEDGRPQTIRYFSPVTDLPLDLGLLVDTSGSMGTLLPRERDASSLFFTEVMRQGRDAAFIAHFDLEVQLLHGLTGSLSAVQNALQQLKVGARCDHVIARGRSRAVPVADGTHLYDAICLSADTIMRKQHGRKALVILSDGLDLGSKCSLTAAIESAQRADTIVYSVVFSDPNFSPGAVYLSQEIQTGQPAATGKEILARLSRETGGRSFAVSRQSTLEGVFETLEEELRSQYSIGYNTNAPISSNQ